MAIYPSANSSDVGLLREMTNSSALSALPETFQAVSDSLLSTVFINPLNRRFNATEALGSSSNKTMFGDSAPSHAGTNWLAITLAAIGAVALIIGVYTYLICMRKNNSDRSPEDPLISRGESHRFLPEII